MYDLIGDIHGYASELQALLAKMQYREVNGVWQHPRRRVIFLGDFMDRGPEQIETLRIARSMVEHGSALAIMGNHEYNAVAWATPDPQHPGQFLRRHSDRNLGQHAEFLQQVGEGSALHKSLIQWFKTLPVYLDLPELRAIHACWHPAHLAVADRITDQHNRLLASAWEASSRKGSAAFNAVETLMKGPEFDLPDGHYFRDKSGEKRTKVRAKWWQTQNRTFRELAMVPASQIHQIPDIPVDARTLPGYDNKKPVFVGHYWLRGEPAPLTDQIACLDYSVAGKHGGLLCGYRFEGEAVLREENFVWVER